MKHYLVEHIKRLVFLLLLIDYKSKNKKALNLVNKIKLKSFETHLKILY